MPKFPFAALDDFRRALDQTFDELLIGPWRPGAGKRVPAIIIERDEGYEVRIGTGDFAPHELEVEVAGDSRLTVRARHGARKWEQSMSFNAPVETEKVTARWAEGVLTVLAPRRDRRTLPKRT